MPKSFGSFDRTDVHPSTRACCRRRAEPQVRPPGEPKQTASRTEYQSGVVNVSEPKIVRGGRSFDRH